MNPVVPQRRIPRILEIIVVVPHRRRDRATRVEARLSALTKTKELHEESFVESSMTKMTTWMDNPIDRLKVELGQRVGRPVRIFALWRWVSGGARE